ncbi:helix-turn-helix domain-containing protein [Saccharothrix syringae]|uniref:XRE family transcriptional regulator n=1 Tax=Saccharothrix syringae TaxID=103733 RepID=A0A5Q0H055_SACSY|nr:helix-turn-helix domain-containing protein [Saccharothrix syringae]QFZ19569.1 XRE family transcriptional regulator [Saccharothrix syringae]
MPAEEQNDSIGARVKRARLLAGITQRRLATSAHVSLSLVKAVEQGRVPASPAFVAAVSRALKADSTYLLGQPRRAEDGEGHRVHAVVPALRREVAAYRIPAEAGVHPRPLPQLARAVAKASKLRHSATLDALGAELPALLAEIRTAITEAKGHDREQLFALLAETYAAAGQVAWKLGYADLSSLITDRIEWASYQSQDPLAAAAADFYVAGELIATAQWLTALDFLNGARSRIEDHLRSNDEAALAMHGVLHLKSGLAAARAGDASTSDAHLAEARGMAKRVTPGSDHYRLAFDRDSVDIWAVGLAVERQDGTEAVKRAQGLRFSATTPRERVGHHWIDLARAYQLHGDRDRALAVLHKARKTTPQQTRYNPQVRETLLTLAAHDRRRSDSLSGFARWAGIKL